MAVSVLHLCGSWLSQGQHRLFLVSQQIWMGTKQRFSFRKRELQCLWRLPSLPASSRKRCQAWESEA